MKRYRYKHILALVLCAAFLSLPVVPVETEAVSVPVFYAGETVLGQAELVCAENTVHKRISIWEKVFG